MTWSITDDMDHYYIIMTFYRSVYVRRHYQNRNVKIQTHQKDLEPNELFWKKRLWNDSPSGGQQTGGQA